jgi:hypothetical protein
MGLPAVVIERMTVGLTHRQAPAQLFFPGPICPLNTLSDRTHSLQPVMQRICVNSALLNADVASHRPNNPPLRIGADLDANVLAHDTNRDPCPSKDMHEANRDLPRSNDERSVAATCTGLHAQQEANRDPLPSNEPPNAVVSPKEPDSEANHHRVQVGSDLDANASASATCVAVGLGAGTSARDGLGSMRGIGRTCGTVYCGVMGGLGNQLYIVAAALSYGDRTGRRCEFINALTKPTPNAAPVYSLRRDDQKRLIVVAYPSTPARSTYWHNLFIELPQISERKWRLIDPTPRTTDKTEIPSTVNPAAPLKGGQLRPNPERRIGQPTAPIFTAALAATNPATSIFGNDSNNPAEKAGCKTGAIAKADIVGKAVYMYSDFQHGYRAIPDLPDQRQVYLTGYFQSPKYFDVSQVRDRMFPASIISYAKELLEDVPDYDRFAFMHFRRGDYKHLQKVHNLLPLDYYERATKHFAPHVWFLVFTEADDLDAIQAEIRQSTTLSSRHINFVDTRIPDYLQLIMMAHCRHGGIIANSSFSAWAAYLQPSYRTIVAPKRWFAVPEEAALADQTSSHWIRIDN